MGAKVCIPQAFVGICATEVDKNLICEFLSTYGIGPCVGLIMYSKKLERAALAHIHDECNVTGNKLKDDGNQHALKNTEEYYSAYIKQILSVLGNPTDDVVITLVPSTMQEKALIYKKFLGQQFLIIMIGC